MQRFDPLTIALQGRQLVEASAGTGKTFSIALLFLRLVLERKLEVDTILVVTFTTSATEELRGRIRDRLREAHDLVMGRKQFCCEEDETLVRLMLQVDDWDEAAKILQDAMARMDESSIYTIHSFCQRVLQDNTLASGIPFEVDFLESELALRREVMEDFWRRTFYQASPSRAAWISGQWSTPDDLLDDLRNLLSKPEVECVPDISVSALEARQQEVLQFLTRVRRMWEDVRDEVASILATDPCLSRNKTNGYGGDRSERAIAAMDEIAASDKMVWSLPGCSELLATSVMAEKLKGRKIVPTHPFFACFDEMYLAHGDYAGLYRVHILREAWNFLKEELSLRKRTRSVLYFDDLLTRLDTALHGPGGNSFAHQIRSRYAVALVDEFQDTDPVQYRIFNRVFGQGMSRGLFMIGDPKQAIYSFRGADIFTYIRAKRQTGEEGRYTMADNYRSTPAMVEAVNQLFDRKGSFIFEKDIPFEPVGAAGSAENTMVQLNGAQPAPMTVLLLPLEKFAPGKKNIAKSRVQRPAAKWCASEIGKLVAGGRSGKATIGPGPVTAGDIAVLVRTHHEADIVQQELRLLGVASVYYSRDSVFATDEARQVHEVMVALVEPDHEPQVRSALITDLFGLTGEDLDQLDGDEMQWAEWLRVFRDYQSVWQQKGFAAMFQALLGEYHLVRRLLVRADGERRLTNFLHLAELIQAAGEKEQGIEGLLRWMSGQREEPDQDASAQQLRLESDENLVKIVTIHKAKGLEFPLVFLPFLWSTRKVARNEIITFHDPKRLVFQADFGSNREEHYRLAEKERLAEDLRMLYVAMTRARYGLYFCWGKINQLEETALAWLLHRDENGNVVLPSEMSEEEMLRDIRELNRVSEVVHCQTCPDSFAVTRQQDSVDREEPSVRRFRGRIDNSWQVTSYSQIVSGREVIHHRDEPAQPRDMLSEPGDGLSVFTFPRGAAAGNFLHGLLEQVDFSSGKEDDNLDELVQDHLNRAGLDRKWTAVVSQWIRDILTTPLSIDHDFCLADLPAGDRLVEMGFYFSLRELDTGKLNRVLSDHCIEPVHGQQEKIRGLMKGFIDLVFRKDGRFFIADYKSNYLGPTSEDYHRNNLERAMKEHRYDLQYLIYSVALHRYLAGRINGYGYDQCFGGVSYLFLRGMNPSWPAENGIFRTRPERRLIEEIDDCFNGRRS